MYPQDIIYEDFITLPGSEQNGTRFHPGHPGSCSYHLRWWVLPEEFTKMWAGSLINCCRPNCEVTESILEPSYVVLLCSYQFEDLALTSPRTNLRNGFGLLILSNESFKLSENSSKESKDSLVVIHLSCVQDKDFLWCHRLV